jgi:type IV secretion system protein VirB3
MEQRRIPIYRVLCRPHLMMGAERKLVILAGTFAGALVFSTMNLVSAIVGVTLWVLSIGLLRLLAKADPYMSEVYRRHIKYRRYYPARSRIWRNG